MRIGVIGGGAAGIFGAVAAATNRPSAEVIVFEATSETLDKVRISGGGRCNVTHNCFDAAELVRGYPRGYKELRGPFSRFQPRDTVTWFEQRGVKLKAETDGRMFPVTDNSATIVDCLLDAAGKAGVRIRLNARAKNIAFVGTQAAPKFDVELHDHESESFDRVLITTGSARQGYRFAESLGHTIVPCVPSLFTFKVKDTRLEGLSGVSFESVKLTLISTDKSRFEQLGPMLITHWGLSGPAVLKLSAWGARQLFEQRYRADLRVSFVPDSNRESVYETLVSYKEVHGKRKVTNGVAVDMPKRYWERLCAFAGIDEESTWNNISKTSINALVEQLTNSFFEIAGKGVFKEEFVTCGGVSLKEVDFATMQSRICPGLFFAGEVLDIDGITGGYNFQSAWTTGWLAGQGMVGGPG